MNLGRIFAIAYKETLQVWRDPRSLAMALLMPLMQMALLGYGVSLDIRRVALCVYDQEKSQISRELVERFTASDWFRISRKLPDERAVRARDGQRRLRRGGHDTGQLFAHSRDHRQRRRVQTVFDATDVNTTNIAIGYAQGIVGIVTADFEQRWAASHGLRPQTVGVVDLRAARLVQRGARQPQFHHPRRGRDHSLVWSARS